MKLITLLVLAAGVATAPAAAAPTGATVLKSAFNAKLKTTILVDGKGRTVYELTSDKGLDKPQCMNDNPVPGCGKTWPPVLGPMTAGKGVDASLLASVTRTDGKVQVTYAKQPLYYFAGEPGEKPDRKPGDVNGQHLFDVWYVMSPAGSPIKKVPKRG